MAKPAAAKGKGKAPVSQSERGAMDKLANYAAGTAAAAASSSAEPATAAASTPTPTAATPTAVTAAAAAPASANKDSASAAAKAAKAARAGKVTLPWTCDGCDRVFKSVAGVRYHENMNVCRPMRNSPPEHAQAVAAASAASPSAPSSGVQAALNLAKSKAGESKVAVPSFTCDICDKSYFKSSKALKYHKDKQVCVRRAEKDAKDRVKRGGRGVAMYSCDSCAKDDFRSKQALDYHVNNKVCVRPVLQCSACDKTNFHSRQAFKYHVEKQVCVRKAEQDVKAADAKTYRESKAQQVLSRRATAQAKKDERERPMVCNVCNKSDFKSRGAFKYHEDRLVCIDKADRPGILEKREQTKAAATAAANLAGAAAAIAAQAVGMSTPSKAGGKKKAHNATMTASLAAAAKARGTALGGTVDNGGRQMYTCELCENSTFKSAKARKYHVDNKVCVRRAERVASGTSRRGPNEILACTLCHKSDFRSRKALAYHTENKVCVRPPLVCSMCEKMDFKSRNAFKYHVEHKVCEKRNENSAVKAAASASAKKNRTDPTVFAAACAAASADVAAARSPGMALTPAKSPSTAVGLACAMCGKEDFNSRNAYKYHVEHKVCVRRAEKRALAAAAAVPSPSSPNDANKKRRTGPGSAMTERFPDV